MILPPFMFPEPEEPKRQQQQPKRRKLDLEPRPYIPFQQSQEDLRDLYAEHYERRVRDVVERKNKEASAKALIAQVAADAAAKEVAAAAAEAEAKAKAEAAAEKAAKRKERALKKSHSTPEDKEALKEKRLMKLVGAVVVKCMSKHSKAFDRDSFKKHAKEVSCLQCILIVNRNLTFLIAHPDNIRKREEIFELSG